MSGLERLFQPVKAEGQAGGNHADEKGAVDEREAFLREDVVDQAVHADDEKREKISACQRDDLNERQEVVLRMGEEGPGESGQEHAP